MAKTAWSSGGHYEAFMGRWSRDVATQFVDWIGAPPGARWLDVGCGTGALTEAIAHSAVPADVVGIDPSASFIDFARERLGDRARFEVAGATSIPLEENAVDVAVSGLVLNFVPDLVRSLAEVGRVVKVRGTAAAYLWDYSRGTHFLDLFWKTASELDDAARDFYESKRFGGWSSARLEQLFAGIGTRVETRSIAIPTVFANFDDYWLPFSGGQGPSPTYLQGLSEGQRDTLREALRERVSAEPDGSIALEARALAVRCSVR